MSLVHSAIVLRRIGATSSTRNVFASALMALIAVGFSGAVLAAHPMRVPDPGTIAVTPPGVLAKTQQPDQHILIQLNGQAAVVSYAAALPNPGGSTSSAGAVAAGRNQILANKAEQATLISAMQAAGIKYTEIYRVQRAMNAVAVIVPAAQVAALSKLPGVKSVRKIVPSYPSSNSSASFVGANQVWQGIPGAQADGTGVRIGIIDTGIDYQHANFGGTGLASDYATNDRVTIHAGLFPTSKVVGGTDLVGDAYNAAGTGSALIPVPDPNPTDCLGHGSHVAGIAAGLGVTTAGASFSGPFDTATLNTLRIQPGIAHNALLYSIKVFGCSGSTDVVVQAIDYALDPNNDMDLSDHLDVINMSLGSDVGNLSDPDVEASEAASLSGMVVVAAAGNAGDTYMIVGAPSVSRRTISVAASWDGGETAGQLTITAPPIVAGTYFAVPAAFGPPIPGSPLSGNLVYALPHNGCAALTNSAAISGNIAVIDRGTCSFEPKVAAAQAAGATAVVVVDSRPEVPVTMGPDGVTANPTIPSVMISQANGLAIEAQLSGTVTGSLGGVPGGDLLASFSSRGPDNGMPIGAKPNITAPGVNIVSTQTGMTCVTGGGCITPTATGFDPGNLSLSISGTSMATPQVAGLVALLRQLHPTLSVEEIKALAMNGSIHDLTTSPGGAGLRYGGGRVGAGRIDAVASANLSMAAFNADGSGTVGVTFPSEIGASTSVTQKVRVKNYSSTPKTISLGIDTVVDNPGVAFSLPGGSSLTLLGNQTLDIAVQMTGQANLVTHTYDPTIFLVQNGNPRAWMTEETSYLTLNAGAGNVLRVPLYVAPYGASTMSGGASVPTGGLASGTATINLTGVGVCTGTLVAGPSCSGNFPITEESLVTPFEWQASNPRNPALAAQDNIHYAGVSTDGSTASFGISLWGPVGQIAAVDNGTEIWIPNATNPQFAVFATYVPDPSGLFQNVMVTDVYSFSAGTVSTFFFTNAAAPNQVDTRVFQNDVYFMPVPLSAIGLGPTDTLSYEILTFSTSTGDLGDDLGPFSFNMGAPGLTFFDSFGDPGGLLLDDLPGAKIPVTFNVANLNANGSLGALLLHHHNKAGTTAETLTVPAATVLAPVFQSAVSRKVHGAAGTFDLPLSAVATNPTTEPRIGPAQTLVFTFDKPVNAATVTVTEGTATAAAPTFSGNDVIVSLSGVSNVQYVTVTLSNVSSADGSSGGTGAVRVGYLGGDVNQNRVVSLSDLLLINAQLAHLVTASNYLKDVNASGTMSLADIIIVNNLLGKALPAP
jgi:subtilisin family serine protease